VAFLCCDIRIHNTSKLFFSELIRKSKSHIIKKKERKKKSQGNGKAVGSRKKFCTTEHQHHLVAWTQSSERSLIF